MARKKAKAASFEQKNAEKERKTKAKQSTNEAKLIKTDSFERLKAIEGKKVLTEQQLASMQENESENGEEIGKMLRILEEMRAIYSNTCSLAIRIKEEVEKVDQAKKQVHQKRSTSAAPKVALEQIASSLKTTNDLFAQLTKDEDTFGERRESFKSVKRLHQRRKRARHEYRANSK